MCMSAVLPCVPRCASNPFWVVLGARAEYHLSQSFIKVDLRPWVFNIIKMSYACQEQCPKLVSRCCIQTFCVHWTQPVVKNTVQWKYPTINCNKENEINLQTSNPWACRPIINKRVIEPFSLRRWKWDSFTHEIKENKTRRNWIVPDPGKVEDITKLYQGIPVNTRE